MSDEQNDDVLVRVIVHDDEVAEKRLARIEAQMRVLAEAVIAMTAPDTITAAIDAVRNEMATTSDTAPHGVGVCAARVPHWNKCPACGSLLTEPLHRSPDGHGYKYFTCAMCQHHWEPRVAERRLPGQV